LDFDLRVDFTFVEPAQQSYLDPAIAAQQLSWTSCKGGNNLYSKPIKSKERERKVLVDRRRAGGDGVGWIAGRAAVVEADPEVAG
jgi:hypothetical protein